ncbi:UPF0182 family protein [Microvirga massiliensis]|uniref:UPF0182 family membrane protein n=1 Tax=Microvirga massiliensis TaxID=1033741 RepID=UPI00062BB071|nr:UPF0182 family protein [Microvirga massiliensis]
MQWRGIAVAAIAIVVCLTLSGIIVDFLVDWIWFSAIGYPEVFWTVLQARISLFLVVFAVTTIVLWWNGWLAFRLSRRGTGSSIEIAGITVGPPQSSQVPEVVHRRLLLLVAGASATAGALVAAGEMTNWNVLLRFLYQVPYGQSDPIFGKDIGFYLFSLPAYVALKDWMLLTVSLGCIVAAGVYWVRGEIGFNIGRWSLSRTVVAHGSVLLGILFSVWAWSYGLDRYLLLYGDNGVVVGASYTDIHVELPVLWVLIGLAVVAALLSWANLWVRTYRLPAAAVMLVLGGAFVMAEVFPVLFERLFVRPNELELEKPYLEQNIALTRQAYGLHRIIAKPFPVEQNLTVDSLRANQATIDNIRLWDEQPLMATYAQLQEIRTYYKFRDVDVDRYWLGGAYQQVMLSARELKSALLPPDAQTWVNQHVLFTHGTGVVMSSVTRKSAEGLPVFYLQDIPPLATGGPPVHEPRIYYGELTDTYVIVRGSTPEFDYPKGKDNVYARYTGRGGIAVGGGARRSLFAWYFNDPNILLSSYITGDSRIMFRRSIRERVHTIAPFLHLDRNPYLVVSDGRLVWVQDAYTTSTYFPYSLAYVPPLPDRGLNYIRNSVKVVVDAYDGSVDFYLTDPEDPIAATYRRIFPGLFKLFAAMPQEMQRHIRYPEDLFFIQAQIYRTYHMAAPEVFYNREDLWQFPRQPTDGNAARMAPYYMIMRLPGEPQAESILMLPMVPSQRENMIAWLAARCDPPHYGELIVYEFPKDKLVYGPFQIEARINQNTAISQQLSLWNQLGSRVIRGNLHVIPIENSILYVSPLYLRAATGQIPELKRVIAAYGDQVVMEETLARALAALFMAPVQSFPHVGSSAEALPATPEVNQTRDALGHYNQAMERLRAGDWQGFGAEMDKLRMTLERSSDRPGDRQPDPKR